VVNFVIGKEKRDVEGINKMVNGKRKQEIKKKGEVSSPEHVERCHKINATLQTSVVFNFFFFFF
jgi:Na+/phosphate symporter